MKTPNHYELFCDVPKCFAPLLSRDLAALLGISPSVLSSDCRLLGINTAVRISTRFDLPSAYRMWCFRVLLLAESGTKRSFTSLITGDLRILAKYMEKVEGGVGAMSRFASAYSYWLSTGKCIRTGGYLRAHPPGLQRYLRRVKRNHGHYALRDVVARHFDTSPATITGYMRGLGYPKGTPITLHVFKRLWRLKRAIDYWQSQLSLYGSRLTYYQRHDYPFASRCTVKRVVALESQMMSGALGLSAEYTIIQSLPLDDNALKGVFRNLVAQIATAYTG
jgi:hypothetical protein